MRALIHPVVCWHLGENILEEVQCLTTHANDNESTPIIKKRRSKKVVSRWCGKLDKKWRLTPRIPVSVRSMDLDIT